MATTNSQDPRDAAADLEAVTEAQRAVRDRPWPVWLYLTNALLLGALALVGLIDSSMIATFVVLPLSIGLAALNYWAGFQMGVPFAIPTSRAFRVLVALSGAFVIASVFARYAGIDWAMIACAAGATLVYAVASVVHYRSVRRQSTHEQDIYRRSAY